MTFFSLSPAGWITENQTHHAKWRCDFEKKEEEKWAHQWNSESRSFKKSSSAGEADDVTRGNRATPRAGRSRGWVTTTATLRLSLMRARKKSARAREQAQAQEERIGVLLATPPPGCSERITHTRRLPSSRSFFFIFTLCIWCTLQFVHTEHGWVTKGRDQRRIIHTLIR